MNGSQSSDRFGFAAVLSTLADSDRAIEKVCAGVKEQLGSAIDLALVFVSQHHHDCYDRLAGSICENLQTDRLIGCSGESIVGGAREVEDEPAISLWAASLADVDVSTMHLQHEASPQGSAIVGWPDELSSGWPEGATMLMLGEPFSFPADVMLERLNEDVPGMPVIGGMASGGSAPGENRLFYGAESVGEGAVVVLLHGALRCSAVVSQGCRPIGNHYVITKAERNEIYELGGKPALIQLKELFDTLPTREQALVQSGLHVGRVVSEYQDHFEQGDFLVRNVVGIDPDRGTIAIGDYVRPGQTIQFHIRDQQTADAELKQLLAAVRDDTLASPAGGLLFTCNGRGTRLFSEPNHDAAAIQAALGDVPLAGFFAQGELGPVGGKNFVHGFTASLVLFEQG